MAGFEFVLAAGTFDLDAMGVEEAGRAGDDIDAIARELALDNVNFRLDDVGGAKAEIGHGDVFLHMVVGTIDTLIFVSGKVKDGFANGFAGDGAGVNGTATDDFEALDESGAFAELGGLDGGALASGTGTDDDEVVLFHNRGESITPFDEKFVTRDGERNPGRLSPAERRSFISKPRFTAAITQGLILSTGGGSDDRLVERGVDCSGREE